MSSSALRFSPSLPVSRRRGVRRTLRAVALAAASVVAAVASTASAAAPPDAVKTQVPGYYRQAVGGFVVTALYDGYVDLETGLLKGLKAAEVQRMIARRFLETTPGVQTAVNAFLIHTGTHLVLVDTGSAQCFGPTLGRIADNLRASGYRPEDVDTVLLTHLHPDHACGLRGSDGQALYPNATVHVSQAEAGFWLSEDIATKAPDGMKPFFRMARESVEPYEANGRLKRYGPDETLLDGALQIVPTHGHTPGHSSYLFRAGGKAQPRELLVWGDIVHSHAVQFRHPEVSLEFDVDQKQAIAARRALFARAAKAGWWIAGAHLPFPGIGHVRAQGPAYEWIPAEFGPIRDDRPDR